MSELPAGWEPGSLPGTFAPLYGSHAGVPMYPGSALIEALGWPGPLAIDVEPGREPGADDPEWSSELEVKAPFPWFGGKSRVAQLVWPAFGFDVPNYIEPFAGSLAMLLARPGGPGKIETCNDRDRYVANFFRAITADPWGVAEWCDWPVNEADLHARHRWLVNQAEFRERMHVDPDYYDVKIAGWWCWGLCCWIGGGWCVEPQNGNAKERNLDAAQRPRMSGDHLGDGVHSGSARTRGANRSEEANRPKLAGAGKGVHRPARRSGEEEWRKRPVLDGDGGGTGGRGIHSPAQLAAYSSGRRPALLSAGQGVHLPSLGNDRGIHGVSTQPGTFLHALRELTVPDAPPCFEWFATLALRLRRVRVACGDWRRVLGDSVLGKGKNVGGRRPCAVFLDPPYSHEFRDSHLYSEDDAMISALVREWALEHGDDPDLRIVLCGYDGEHKMPASWRELAWKGARGYAGETNENRQKERLWFSPHCLKETPAQGILFI